MAGRFAPGAFYTVSLASYAGGWSSHDRTLPEDDSCAARRVGIVETMRVVKTNNFKHKLLILTLENHKIASIPRSIKIRTV